MNSNISEKRIREIILEELNNIDTNHDGIVSKEEIHGLFDTNNDGLVKQEEYEDKLEWLTNNSHVIKPYQARRVQSHKSVPCKNTYDKASKYLLRDVDSIYNNSYESINNNCGAECPVSVMSALVDIMRSVEEIEVE